MKKLVLMLFLFAAVTANAQFKEEANKKIDIKSGITNYSPSGLVAGFFNPNNFDMKHSVSMSYSTFGGQGMALGVYTNTMSYKFTDDLRVSADVSIVNSPYSSMGDRFAEQVNGVYLSRAQLDYKISDESRLFIQYRSLPAGTYNPYYYGYSPFRSNSFFGEQFGE